MNRTREASLFERRIQTKIFLSALTIRWAYALILFAFMGNNGILGQDSRGYLEWSEAYVARLIAGSIHGWELLSPEMSLMPLGPWLWNICVLVFGSFAALAVVLIQGILDATTCVLIYRTARRIIPRAAFLAGIAACLNPTQIIMSGLLYTDTLFLFFVAVTLLASVAWLQAPSWPATFGIGLGLGGAALSRILIVPWGACLILFLLAVALLRGWFSVRIAKQIAATTIILGLSIAPIVARNVIQYDSWALTPQTGSYYSLWLAPLVRQAKDGTPWEVGAADMQKRIQQEAGNATGNLFENSRRNEEIGKQALRELGLTAVAKAWIFGAAINLGAPAVTLSPPVIQLPRIGFYRTPGTSMSNKIFNFLFRSDNALYSWLLLLGIVGVAVIRFVQGLGLVLIARDRSQWPSLLLLGSWVGFILAINGPIASPKYRLPIEPPLMILTGAGLYGLRETWRRQQEPQQRS